MAAGAALAAGLTFAAPAAAVTNDPVTFDSVTYDPDAKTGFVDRGDVRKAFGWSEATLAARATGLVFDHEFWSRDTYSVACGQAAFPVEHHRAFGHYGLTDELARDPRRGAATGYQGRPAGFRITGAHYGISGTTVPPMVGQPCPEEQGRPPGTTIDRVRLVSSASGWALTVTSGDVRRELLVSVGDSTAPRRGTARSRTLPR
ncbi:MAG: hypothetical protein ABW046_20200 [Actinoplanes sp.]